MSNIKFLTLISVLLLTGMDASAQGQSVVLGTGSAISVFSPLNRTNDYCVYEAIYFQSQINLAGPITALGYQRHDGTDTDSIENVRIYMKHTQQNQLFAGSFDTTGYTLVYSGSFPNDAGAGWREVVLDTNFIYTNQQHLQILTVKDYQPAIANTPVTPRWIYTNISPDPARARRYYGAVPITSSTNLTTTTFTSNAILTFNTTSVVEIGNAGVSVFPNPVKNKISFHFDLPFQESQLQILNVEGRSILVTELPQTGKYETQKLNPGMYFYVIRSSDLRIITKGKVVVIE